ncbi:RNA polymerase II mediator complex component Srb8 [Cordyceps fumosorosea ARSEF 2679]|uniref:Mediator of RNA polymerase II transcription subunit 12 n=1 Tax=Cordyceps fumosorosea (strain ARSEF 2679) TaxID=1081104 RepID=A0A167NLQ8_CORFA|nr:RNA polymerase II mediator complex component Srb8 [Cordyceps fumosorosea ARSEF 2679]OAA55694.1 RNA polymerase II mediator complex component Srb8 [Cordyceps fumosorosea ARSEF 2679]
MSSRNPKGAQQRAQQRAPTGSALQAHQRSISSSHIPPPSPVRRDGLPDHSQPTDPADTSSQAGTAGRHGATPRRTAGSKLRIELSNDDSLTPGPVTDSPQGTPSVMSHSAGFDSSADVSGHGSPALSRASQSDLSIPRMPMPRRRAPLQRFVPSNKTAAPPTAPIKRDSKPKQYTIEVPAAAPRYLTTNKPDTLHRDPFNKGLFSGHADFFPWTGRHHEDEWSTEAIQKGTWDRGSQNETSSARLAVYPSLKQKTGLNALSTIFMGVLNQRRNRGQITAPSTFKPPPRVTLTDTKREVWLKDLANPTISLRRLSRTIPHGIRGRTLLDQCLNKNVPTERAVWLAKCVGANEIRAFKRKGVTGALVMGNELKWIRDWTIFVEQFVDSVVSSVGEPDWKHRVTYSIRLATVLYSEHLLDRDHYLDWIVSGLENSSQAKLPMWILIAQICWTDILRSRKPGRRLVFALLNHLNTIYNDPDRDILIPLSNQLVSLLKSLVAKNPESFIQPLQWLKYRDCLSAFLSTDERAIQQALRSINHRNSELLVSTAASPPVGGKEHLVKLLDTTLHGKVDHDLSSKCWAISEDKTQILKTVIEWVTSFHRPGLEKIYTATNLLRSWASFRVNTTGAILDTLDSIEPDDEVRKQAVYRLVIELARTGHFSVSQYIQWLIARGNCHNAADVEETGPCASRLLVELPVSCIPEDRKMDRANLLRRAAHYDVADEARDISTAIKCVNQTIGLPLPNVDDYAALPSKPLPLRKLVNRISVSSFALKSAVGVHLCNEFRNLLPPRLDTDVSLNVFTSSRTILESTKDFSMLGEVLKSCSKMSNIEVLAVCVDTINVNLEVLLAVGIADELFALYFERLKAASREHGLVARPLLAALSSLAQRMPNQSVMAKNLQQELTQTDRTNPIDACSPVSDNMVSQATSPEGEFSEQIDKLLATGNSVDHPTMNRLFLNIVPRLEAGWNKLDASRRVYASLLARLRIFDSQHFDKLMSDWVSHIRSLKERPALLELLPLLVSLGCLTMVTVLHTANAAPVAANVTAVDSGPPRGSAIYLQELLQLILRKLPKQSPLTAEESYRFVVYQQAAKIEHSKALLLLIRNAVQEYSILRSRSTTTALPLDDRTCQDDVLEALRVLVVTNSTAAAEALSMKDLAPDASALIRTVAAKLLTPGDENRSSSFDKILGLANELTMPFCQLSLSMELSLPQDNRIAGNEPQESQFDVFARAMDSAIEARNILWTSMLPCLSDDITQHLRSQAHGRFLKMIPSSKATNFAELATSEDRIQLAKNLLGVIEAIISAQPPSKSAQLTTTLVDKLTDLWEIVSVREASAAQDAIRKHWLPFLLRFITLHSIYSSSASDTSTATASTATPGSSAVNKAVSNVVAPAASATTTANSNHEARARIVLVLCGILFALESQQTLPPDGKLAQQVFDIALLLVDALPDDMRLHCARNVLANPSAVPSSGTSATSRSGTSDPRIYYLFSAPRPTAADNLMLAHRERGSIPLSAAARGLGAMYGIGPTLQERYSHFALRRWEALSEPTPNVGENDTSLSLGLFEAIKIQ